MKRYEYKVLSFDTSGDEPNSRELATLDMEIEIDSHGSEGYELRNTNVIGHTIYVFLMREKP